MIFPAECIALKSFVRDVNRTWVMFFQMDQCQQGSAIASIRYHLCLNQMNKIKKNESIESVVLGGGCFWCLEAVFNRVEGILSVVSGYAGGSVSNPNYEQVSSGKAGHAEVIQITFDSRLISLKDILRIFFSV